MPDEKKNLHKGKNDAKEQRKPRQGRNKGGPTEKNVPPVEKKPTVPSVPQKPVYEEPGPEFYKNLKRETDEILKITEETNSKYKKKEIQSNWSKYEMPIETYDEFEQQESMGADYEQLIQMPLSVGGHFQFKHEKSWDIETAPSLYDKYFDFHMNDLANAICTIPFYERNSVDNNIFTDTDIKTMDNRATKYKQKYYNDKSYITLESSISENILNKLLHDEQINVKESIVEDTIISEIKNNEEEISLVENLNDLKGTDTNIVTSSENTVKEDNINVSQRRNSDSDDDIEDLIVENIDIDLSHKNLQDEKVEIESENESVEKPTTTKLETTKNPVIESSEDLEKWLDDFLDG